MFKSNKLSICILIFGLSAFISCHHNKTENNPLKDCVTLNDSAFRMVSQKYWDYNSDSIVLNDAIALYKEAIRCDSDYYEPYYNLMVAYWEKKDCEGVRELTDCALKRFPLDPLFHSFKSAYYKECLNQPSLSKEYSDKTCEGYDEAIRKGQGNATNIAIAKIEFVWTVYGNKTALCEIDSFINEFPREKYFVEYRKRIVSEIESDGLTDWFMGTTSADSI